eukprot:Skav228793  [mRNA]  locus=scaffold589:723489:724660:- [translate_table: standard]
MDVLRSSSSADDRLAVLLKTSEKLCPMSLWGIYDPPRASVPGSIEKCRKAGIQVKMITGDQQATAAAIGQQIGILDESCGDDCTILCQKLHENHGRTRVKERRISRRASEILRQTQDPGGSTHLGAKQTWDFQDIEVVSTWKLPRAPMNLGLGCINLVTVELQELIGKVRCFSRALPSDKVAIVDSLMACGQALNGRAAPRWVGVPGWRRHTSSGYE